MVNKKDAEQEKLSILKNKLKNRMWRLTSGKIYKIKDKEGNTVPFIPNEHQMEVLNWKSPRKIIPKARQLWFSTLIAIDLLDLALFNRNTDTLIISHDQDSMHKIFKSKVKFARDHLPDRVQNMYTVDSNSANSLRFSTDGKTWSSISVALSGRSGTYQAMHISEFGKICAKYPAKAKEIVTGALEAVPSNGRVYIESTAEWSEWYFYEWSMKAKELKDIGKEPNKLEYKLFFFPWWKEDWYVLEDVDDEIDKTMQKYFERLSEEKWIELSHWQKMWYISKQEQMWEDMKREYPSFLEECFEWSLEWRYYSHELALANKQQRLTRVMYDDKLPVYIVMDLWWPAWSDLYSLWFLQLYWKEVRIINYREGNGDLEVIGQTVIPKMGYWQNVKKIISPWDWWIPQLWDSNKTRVHELKLQGYIVEVLKQSKISRWIAKAKKVLKQCRFDTVNCWDWIKRLKNYKKKRNTTMWRFMEKPEHDINSHWADWFRYLSIRVDKRMSERSHSLNETSKRKPKVSHLTRKASETSSSSNKIPGIASYH